MLIKLMGVEVDLLSLKLLVTNGCKLTTWLSHDLNTTWIEKGHQLGNRWSRVFVLKANWYVFILLCICRYIPCKMQLSSIYLHSNRHVHLLSKSYFLSFYVLIGSQDLASECIEWHKLLSCALGIASSFENVAFMASEEFKCEIKLRNITYIS